MTVLYAESGRVVGGDELGDNSMKENVGSVKGKQDVTYSLRHNKSNLGLTHHQNSNRHLLVG